MKIIELLNKIANGEEIPEKIKYQYKTFELDGHYVYVRIDKVKEHDYGYKDLFDYISVTDDLTDNVEIIEEDKEIEEIKELSIRWRDNDIIVNEKIMQEDIDEVFADKINELIKAVNELKKGK